MSTCNVSFVTLPSTQVRELAEACIERVLKHRRRRKDEILAEYRDELQRSWWHRFWVWTGTEKPALLRTNDEIEADINRQYHPGSMQGLFSPLRFVACDYQNRVDVANRLLDACKYADSIQVSTDDLYMITP